MQEYMRHGFGLVLGGVLCKVLSFVLGLFLLSAVGLVMTGHLWMAVMIAGVGFLLYDGGLRLLLRRRRRAH